MTLSEAIRSGLVFHRKDTFLFYDLHKNTMLLVINGANKCIACTSAILFSSTEVLAEDWETTKDSLKEIECYYLEK